MLLRRFEVNFCEALCDVKEPRQSLFELWKSLTILFYYFIYFFRQSPTRSAHKMLSHCKLKHVQLTFFRVSKAHKSLSSVASFHFSYIIPIRLTWPATWAIISHLCSSRRLEINQTASLGTWARREMCWLLLHLVWYDRRLLCDWNGRTLDDVSFSPSLVTLLRL